MSGNSVPSPPPGFFADTIDGYFPLAVSLGHCLKRHNLSAALIELRFAPIMHIPGLAHIDPVPLSVHSGRAGLIDRLDLLVHAHGDDTTLVGCGQWTWLGSDAAKADMLDPMTRLAEPAYVEGVALKDTLKKGSKVSKIQRLAPEKPDHSRPFGQFETVAARDELEERFADFAQWLKANGWEVAAPFPERKKQFPF